MHEKRRSNSSKGIAVKKSNESIASENNTKTTEEEPPSKPEKEKERDKKNETASSSKASNVISTNTTNTAIAASTNSSTASNPTTNAATTASTETTAATRPIALAGPPCNYYNRRNWITTERMYELRRRAQEAIKHNKTFTIRGCFNSVRNALTARGWVEKLDAHRKHANLLNTVCQVNCDDLAQSLPKRKPGETRRQYIAKCELNIMSRFLEHMPIDFLWTNRKEKCDYIDQSKNPWMLINKFHRAPFTTKEGLCNQLKDFHWFYEEGTAEMYFPRCFNVWSPEELAEFVDNFKLTACIGFLRMLVDKYRTSGFDAVFSPIGKIPFSTIDFAYKRCTEYIDSCNHNDIDVEDPPRIWEHDWDAFLYQQNQLTCESGKILADPQRLVEHIIKTGAQLLENLQEYWPQYSLDGYQNLWIVKPANKCRGRGIQLMDNLKKILGVVNPSIASKSRYVVQKYIERPLIIHHTKFDIRQWFLITNVQPLVVWMYKESYLRFSSQEYSLTNHHESVHLTNHAIQKKYTNGKRDKRLPVENMWDCYSFQAYLRQIGKQDMWLERIYPGMRKAIVGTMLASQENMDRRPNTFELFGADFMICEDFYPWLIEINSSPDLGATTSVTARMCPQCLEDVVKVVIDRRQDPKADTGNFELIYRQMVPPTPAYMGLNLSVKGKQILSKINHNSNYYYQRRERSLNTSNFFRQRTALIPTHSNTSTHKAMPVYNATDYMEKVLNEAQNSSRSSNSNSGSINTLMSPASSLRRLQKSPTAQCMPCTPCPNLLRTPQVQMGMLRRSFTNLCRASICNKPKASLLEEAKENKQVELKNSNHAVNKRHRSCGARLNGTAAENEDKFKLIIKNFKQEAEVMVSVKVNQPAEQVEISKSSKQAEEVRTAEETKSNMPKMMNSKSADNLVNMLQKSKRKLSAAAVMRAKSRTTSAILAENKSFASVASLLKEPLPSNAATEEQPNIKLKPAIPKTETNTANLMHHRKWRSLKNISNKSVTANEAKDENCKPAVVEAVSATNQVVGKSLTTWKTSKRAITAGNILYKSRPNSIGNSGLNSQKQRHQSADATASRRERNTRC